MPHSEYCEKEHIAEQTEKQESLAFPEIEFRLQDDRFHASSQKPQIECRHGFPPKIRAQEL